MSSSTEEAGSREPPSPTRNNEIKTSDSSESDNDTPTVVKPRPPPLAVKMLNMCKEITVMLLIAVVYAALTNESPPKVSKSPAAYPFFPSRSPVSDWYRGQITEAIEDARSSDIAFVMFYAPWDAQSQRTRTQFEGAARLAHQEVTFAAINCWQPGSECKRQYSKVYRWPVLIAYPTHGRGVQYNGPLDALHMLKFLRNVCNPLLRPGTVEELFGKHDVVVSAALDLRPGSREYAIFYSTALRFLERDPFREVAFAVLPKERQGSARIRLHVWNGTIEYGDEVSVEGLMAWIGKNAHQLTSWVTPTGMKSLTMASFVQPGPALILFTPKNPLQHTVDLFNMLRHVAYEYHNCINDSATMDTRIEQIKAERLKGLREYEKLKRECFWERPKEVITSVPNLWTNNSLKDICNCVSNEWKVCGEEREVKIIPTDRMSTEFLQKKSIESKCKQFLLAEKETPLIFEKNRNQESDINVTGLACKTNISLTFVALDSSRFYHFAEKLGMDLMNFVDKSGLVIVDEKMETHHILEEKLNGRNVRFFIQNFTQRTLPRSLRSKTRLKAKYQQNYPKLTCAKHESLFCVEELTSTNFLNVILQPNKVIIVLYYSKQCAFCSGVSHVFLTVAKLLTTVKEVIFTRIDGDVNLLPWEYTMDAYPTILFVPAKRKSESQTFPKNMRVTAPNVLGFLLTNVEPVLRLKMMWSLCQQAKFEDEIAKCLISVRVETLTTINRSLKEWRLSKVKHKVLHKLQVLRHLHLLLAHSPEKVSEIEQSLRNLRD